MATALSCRLPPAGTDRRFYVARKFLVSPHIAKRPEVTRPNTIARSGAAAAIASISPLEPSSLSLITTAKIYLTILGAGALAYALSLDSVEQKESGKECPRCNGTGREVCWCRGWSDGDTSGCQSCNYSGFTSCKACGGGGTAVPIPLKIRADEDQSQQ